MYARIVLHPLSTSELLKDELARSGIDALFVDSLTILSSSSGLPPTIKGIGWLFRQGKAETERVKSRALLRQASYRLLVR